MFVFTFVAGLFTFQYDKPHFDPLPRLPPNRARTHTDSPVMSRSSFCHVGDSITFFSVCVGCASRFHHRGKSLSYRTPRRVNPPNLPFYCGGVSPPVPPRCLRSSNRRFTRKARHEVRGHVRRRVGHKPARQTAPRPEATGATEQGNCNDRIVEP